jgi:hypothetical protein
MTYLAGATSFFCTESTKGLEPTIRMREAESPSDVLLCLRFHNTCMRLDQPCFVFLEIRNKNL